MAVGARTVTAIAGGPSSQLGVSRKPTAIRSGLNLAAGSINFGLIGRTAFHFNDFFVVSATSGAFACGSVHLSSHHMLMGPST